MSLASQIASDVASVFLNTGDFATAIRYRRGGAEISLTALASESLFETSTEFGITRTETRDYLIQPSELTFGSSLGETLPERGDKIIEGTRTYVVTNPGGGPAYRWEDENRLLLRVHTTLAKDC